MALEPNNTSLDFETMLRRHLSRGGGTVSACAGFDADAANAYLEGALTGAMRANYEGHLAGCSACRRHIIELSRLSQLSQLTPQAGTQEAAVVAPAGWVRGWKSAVLDRIHRWADLSTWLWDWRLAVTAAAACLILATATIVKPWRGSERLEDLQSAAPADGAASEIAMSPTPAPAFESPPAENFSAAVTDIQPIDQDRNRTGVPSPKVMVTPGIDQQGADQMVSQAQGEALNRQMSREPVAAPQSVFPGATAFTAQPPAPAPLTVSRRVNASPVPVEVGRQSAADSAAMASTRVALAEPVIAPRMTPNPEYNPMQSGAGDERRKSKAQDDKPLPSSRRADWTDRVMGYMPLRKEESAEKSSASVKDDETVSSLVRKIRDKTFIYQKRSGGGVWVDQAYKPELMYWRVKQIARGSEEYDRILAETPQLKEFFSIGKVILVWGDKVYRVTGP